MVVETGDKKNRGKGTSAFGNRYLATVSEDCNRIINPSASYSNV
jgi:hypothetical protein